MEAAYDRTSFQNTPVSYHKFPIKAKILPTEEEVVGFIAIVKECLATSLAEGIEDAQICVHCHYGFNRTGFMICSWLIKEKGYGINLGTEVFSP